VLRVARGVREDGGQPRRAAHDALLGGVGTLQLGSLHRPLAALVEPQLDVGGKGRCAAQDDGEQRRD